MTTDEKEKLYQEFKKRLIRELKCGYSGLALHTNGEHELFLEDDLIEEEPHVLSKQEFWSMYGKFWDAGSQPRSECPGNGKYCGDIGCSQCPYNKRRRL